MASHPPIPVTELADHLERLKANDNLKFSQEYEVSVIRHSWKSPLAKHLSICVSIFSLILLLHHFQTF